MKDVMTFLNGVVVNNNRPWFQENKDLYNRAQNRIYEMAEQLISGISKFDSSIKNLSTMSVAGVAHPVERHLAKVEVASSSLVTRSIKTVSERKRSFFI